MSSCLNSCGLCGRAYQEPGREARGHEEVAGALGRRAGQRRRLDLDEVALAEHPPGGGVDLGAQADRVPRRLGARAAQVEVAVLEPGLLADGDPLVDLEGQRRRRVEHLDARRRRPRPRRWAGRGWRCPRRARVTSPTTLTSTRCAGRGRRPVSTSSRATTWATPLASRRSRKATPPWSRRRATHPVRVTVWPVWAARRVPASWVRSTGGPSDRGHGVRMPGARRRRRPPVPGPAQSTEVAAVLRTGCRRGADGCRRVRRLGPGAGRARCRRGR